MSAASWEPLERPERLHSLEPLRLLDLSPADRSTGRTVTPDADGGLTHHRRVRHELRDALAVMAFSAAGSCLLAVLLMLLMRLGAQSA